MRKGQRGFEVRVIFRERVAIEPILHRFHAEVLAQRSLSVSGGYADGWIGFVTRAHGSIHDSDRQAVFRWLKAQPEVVKCSVELPTHVKVREVRDLILSLV